MLALVILPFVHVAIELDIDRDIMALEFPGVEVQPVIWNFDLVSVDNFLLEDTISVAEPVAPSRVVERSHRIEETGGETTKTAIPERSIVLLLNDVFHAEAHLAEALCSALALGTALCEDGRRTRGGVLLPNVEHGIVESSPHQELEG